MPSHITVRLQFGLYQDPKVITRQMLKLVDQAPIDEVMFFFYAEEHNDGHDTLQQVQQWIDHSRPYRQALADKGIQISLNPWHTLLHADRGRRLKPGQNWQTMVDPYGRCATAQVCPLDPHWREYIAQVMRMYAKEGFRVIWIDDDIRFHNHGPLRWGGCFCPLHVAEFNRRTGLLATRDQIVAHCTAPGQPHPWRAAWFDMWEDTHLAMIAQWRDIVQTAGGNLGLMSSWPECHGAEGRRWENWFEAFAGDKPLFHRPHYWMYCDQLGSRLPNFIALLDQNRSLQPDGVQNGPEIDCGIPYGKWNRPFRQIGAQMALAHILGATELNISIHDHIGNDPDDEPQRQEFLRQWRPTLDWLADTFPMGLRPVGVGIPWSQDMGRTIRTPKAGDWFDLQCPTRGWASWLGAAGHAFCMRQSPAINAIGGPVAWSFTDDQLRQWLAGGLLLDGVAAGILLERGFGDWIGLQAARRVTQDDVLYSLEHATDPAFALRLGAEISMNGHDYTSSILLASPAAGAKVATDLRGPRQQVVGPGLVLFENALGGRVAVVPWRADGEVSMPGLRAVQLTRILRWLDRNNDHGWVEGGAWLVPQFLSDGKHRRTVVWNASGDELEAFEVHLPAGWPNPTNAVQIDAHGRRHPAGVSGGQVKLSRPLYQFELVVLS